MRSILKTAGLAAATFLAASTPEFAGAQALPDVTSYCSNEASFGQSFGADVTGRGAMGNWATLRLDDRFAPFTEGEVVVSQWGRRIHSVSGTAHYPDAEAARAAADRMSEQFATRAWIERPPRDEDEESNLFDPPLAEGEHQYFSEAGGLDDEAPSGVRASLFLMGSSLTLECRHLSLFDTGLGEAFARPPIPHERPVPPTPPTFAALSATDCNDPARRSAIAERPGDYLEPILGYGGELGRHTQLLMAWHADHFIRAGRWTRERESQFALALLGNPAVEHSMATALSLIDELMNFIQAAGRTRDPDADCRATVALQDIMRRLLTAHQEQWQAIDAAYAVEARRLDVDLD